MVMKFDGMEIEELTYVNKVPYKFHMVSAPLLEESDKLYDAMQEEKYKNNFGKSGLGVLRRYDEYHNRAIYYVSIPKIFIKDKEEKIYQLYDVINIKNDVDKGRGKDLVLSMTYKDYNFKTFKDYNLNKLYLYVETQEEAEVSVNE